MNKRMYLVRGKVSVTFRDAGISNDLFEGFKVAGKLEVKSESGHGSLEIEALILGPEDEDYAAFLIQSQIKRNISSEGSNIEPGTVLTVEAEIVCGTMDGVKFVEGSTVERFSYTISGDKKDE